MSAEYAGQNPLDIAKQAERDLNSTAAKTGSNSASDSTNESGVDEAGAARFAGGSVTYGSAASGAGDGREIPASEGGGVNPNTGRSFKAGDYEGLGGPEDKAQANAEARGGDNDVRGNIRQKGESAAASDVARDGPAGGKVSARGPGYTEDGMGAGGR
ncbi:hypothetical protein LTR62_003806 [Meristemomyces frigidus]|uniref:Uncharacterized protein n=1 Tax=Meristemomyces frigidus TaxID=1508187 RepID=A0AAN7YK91_9PEZI|nr:hypothetical protein LTR62_003806 [Meristemomyces frigidus]